MSGTVELEAELKPCPMSDEDKVRFRRSPCFICGYNGPGYYQRETHKCAARYHATYEGLCATLRADNERLGRELTKCENMHLPEATSAALIGHMNCMKAFDEMQKQKFAAEAERDTLLAQVEKMREALEEIATRDVHPYIQIGDDPNECGPTIMIDGQYAKIARAALTKETQP